jgi:hypothetical protein
MLFKGPEKQSFFLNIFFENDYSAYLDVSHSSNLQDYSNYFELGFLKSPKHKMFGEDINFCYGVGYRECSAHENSLLTNSSFWNFYLCAYFE